jgi:hypothetical protein
MSETHPARLSRKKLLAECEVRHERRSGPGGQHRNKVATAVVICHAPTGTRAEANECRSQAENLRVAVQRLRVRLAVELRSTESATAPSDLWRSRVRAGRVAVNPEHDDFPALLAEVLDAVALAEFDVTSAARQMRITTSQLVRFLKLEPSAWSGVNESRRRRGLRPLK